MSVNIVLSNCNLDRKFEVIFSFKKVSLKFLFQRNMEIQLTVNLKKYIADFLMVQWRYNKKKIENDIV